MTSTEVTVRFSTHSRNLFVGKMTSAVLLGIGLGLFYHWTSLQDYDRGVKSRIDPASCLLHASQNAVQVGLEAIQALGGNGYINEFPAGRLLRDAKLYDIGAGTNEIRRMLIGRELFEESV